MAGWLNNRRAPCRNGRSERYAGPAGLPACREMDDAAISPTLVGGFVKTNAAGSAVRRRIP